MKIIQEDTDTLSFEERPNANPDKKVLLITFILASLFLLAGSFKSINISDLLFEAVIWSLIFYVFFVLGQQYIITVKIDKKTNLVLISGFLPHKFSWERKPIEIPISDIKKIEYDTWEPYPFSLTNLALRHHLGRV